MDVDRGTIPRRRKCCRCCDCAARRRGSNRRSCIRRFGLRVGRGVRGAVVLRLGASGSRVGVAVAYRSGRIPSGQRVCGRVRHGAPAPNQFRNAQMVRGGPNHLVGDRVDGIQRPRRRTHPTRRTAPPSAAPPSRRRSLKPILETIGTLALASARRASWDAQLRTRRPGRAPVSASSLRVCTPLQSVAT